ncbi:hypothetical protein [Geomonas sp.]|uniref:hypothetical protein n=1 Tax=Geomonas sp. TaxID=2651584 RepID=UPI002B49B4CD|nr:hypothetical protein [Geomonas sp.]HJV33960.1 hypothetical protein [Geomonas sp.]
MKDDEIIHSDVLNYFNSEFDALDARLKTGGLGYKERVLVSRKIDEAVHLLSPYVRSDPRARHLVRSAETLKKELLSVREMIVSQLSEHPDHQALWEAIMAKKSEEAERTP